MAKKSRYDQLHDKYYAISTTKAGTRYERLAALVFKSLDEKGVVIHDLKLVGETGVEHQIDVVIEVDGKKRHVLIECKDFDISGDKVGLDIVRNFYAVADDTKPDEKIIITCNDFTADAKQYAAAKGLKLAILREFKESDWDDKIKAIHIDFDFLTRSTPVIDLAVGDEKNLETLKADLASAGIRSFGVGEWQPVFVNTDKGPIQINDFVSEKISEFKGESPGRYEIKVDLKGMPIQVQGRAPVPVVGMTIKYEVSRSERHFQVTSNKVAELILQGFGDSDLIVFADDLKRWSIDPKTGEVN